MVALSTKSKLIPSSPAAPRAPRSETVLVTPELARKWLEENMRTNRPVSDRTMQVYAKDMAEGKWTLNGESIKFDVDESLIDGQHRLWACVESSASFKSIVTWDLPDDAFATIDTGKKRSAADVMHVAGIDVPHKTHIAAAARMVMSYRAGARDAGRQGGIPNATILNFLHDEPGITSLVRRVKASLGKPLGGMTSPVTAVLYLASKKLSVDEFLEKLGSGEGLVKASPILTLRNKLLAMSGNKDVPDRFWSVAVAWNAYVEGRPLQVIRIPQDPPRIQGSS